MGKEEKTSLVLDDKKTGDSFREISCCPYESISNINKAGFPIWYSKDYKTIWFDRETPHYVYLGSTGSGKSVTAVIPTCSFIANAKEERSVFITDPKGEIFNKTSKMFKDKGYKIITIDFRHPELSNKFNILQPIINEYKQYIKYDNDKTNLEKKIDELNNLNIELKNKINIPRTRKTKKESYNNEIEKKAVNIFDCFCCNRRRNYRIFCDSLSFA